MDTEERISQLLADPTMPVDLAWAQGFMPQHPTFVVLAALMLARNGNDLDAGQRLRLQWQVVLGCPDRAAIVDLADLVGCDWANFYPMPEKPIEKTTEDTIDVFIDTYGHSSPEEDALLERLLFNPVAPDYFQGADEPFDPADPLALPPELASQTVAEAPVAVADRPQKSEDEGAAAQKAKNRDIKPQKTQEDPPLMESLAKIFIKQRRYERALEIISDLSLKYPEKSVYFADQIRFLQKIILNSRFADNKNT